MNRYIAIYKRERKMAKKNKLGRPVGIWPEEYGDIRHFFRQNSVVNHPIFNGGLCTSDTWLGHEVFDRLWVALRDFNHLHLRNLIRDQLLNGDENG